MTALLTVGCTQQAKETHKENNNLDRAQILLDSIYAHYSVPNTSLLRETYPFDEEHKTSYQATEEQASQTNPFSYLWPYSGTFSAVNVLMESDEAKYKPVLDNRVLDGLEEYFDTKREPYAYASYINTAPLSDRFYDDNVWLGIDFTDTYMQTQEEKYLDKAKLIWKFILSGIDDKLGGGIYWCEQKKESKNTCSNAPGSVYAFKLFAATQDSSYFHKGQELYEWTKKQLQDSTDYLYFDNISLEGKIGRAKYAYNSGQMIQSAALQYKLTKDEKYLKEAQKVADASYNYFFYNFTGKDGKEFRMIKNGEIWFTAVMMRGFIELYHLDNNRTYIDAFEKSLDYAWDNARDEKGLISSDLTGAKPDNKKWLLTQAALVEMYARLALL